jgi:capsular exopolysaccharide synthesis family protein
MNNFAGHTDKIDTYHTEESINFRELFFSYFRYWRWFILSAIVSLIVGTLLYLSFSRNYEVSTAVLLKEEGSKASSSSAIGNLESLGLISTTNNIDNEIAVFSSPNLIRQVVDTLDLYITYLHKNFFRKTEVYKECPYVVELKGVHSHKLKGAAQITLAQVSKGIVSIDGSYEVGGEKIRIPSGEYILPHAIPLPTGEGELVVNFRRPDRENHQAPIEDSYIVNVVNTQAEVDAISSEIIVESTSKSSSVLNIRLRSGNPHKAVDLLREIVSLYNKNNVMESNEIALNTSRFINERLLDISSELKSVENKVVNYKKQHGITDVTAETKVFLEQNAESEKKRIEAETQLQLVQLIEDFINKSDNQNKLIPNLGISDQGLASIIGEYNNLLLSYERIERSASDTNPARTRLLASLKNMRQNIQSAILNVKKAMNINKREIANQSELLASRKQSMPTQEYGLAEILRQQQIIQAIYIFLMQTREESNITLAATSAKAKVITDPIIPPLPVSPKRNLILLISFLLGLIVPILVIYVSNLLKITIANRDELERLAIPSIIGEIMTKEEEGEIVVKRNSTSPIVELFRSLRNNIHFVMSEPHKKIILITSTVPNEGKTFVSINLAASFALSEKRVLLIGMDIRNPQLASEMGFPKGKGLTSYLLGDEDWKNLLCHISDYPNMDILQAGVVPPNPNELLMRPNLQTLLQQARQVYDIILIDSAPVGVVSDTFLIGSHVDATIYVTREKVTPKQAISFVNTIYEDQRLKNISLVINDVSMIENRKKYGYGYTYGYGNTPEFKKRKKN